MSRERPDLLRLRLQLLEAVFQLPDERLGELQSFFTRPLPEPQHIVLAEPSNSIAPPPALDWPHAPLHRIGELGTYIVTGSTHFKEHLFRGPAKLDALQAELLCRSKAMGWQLEAWAVFSNHYHFIAHAQTGADPLSEMIKKLHGTTSHLVNEMDGCRGRKVWFNYWDTRLTFEASYLARLNYVHQNAVKHGLVQIARDCRWCSAGWYERTARQSMVETVRRFKTDQVKIRDDYDPVL